MRSPSGGLGSVSEGQGQQGRGGCRRRSRSRSSSRIGIRTCIGSGIGCRRAAISRRRCERWRSLKREAKGFGFSAYRPWLTGSRRRWSGCIWSRRSSRSSIRTPTATGRGKSALDAVGTCRQRCWRADWVIDLDIRAFFDTVPWDLVLKAVAHHTDQRWILLYVRRWLEAPLQQAGRHAGRPGSWDPAGVGDLPVVGEPVHALRVRRLDGPGVPRPRVRALLR